MPSKDRILNLIRGHHYGIQNQHGRYGGLLAGHTSLPKDGRAICRLPICVSQSHLLLPHPSNLSATAYCTTNLTIISAIL